MHEYTPLDEVADVVSVMQTPAFLCRQTDFIFNVCSQGLPVNIKKGQFLAPLDMLHCRGQGEFHRQRASHGVRTRLLIRLQQFGVGHAFISSAAADRLSGRVSMPRILCRCLAAWVSKSGGQREMVPVLARAALGVGVDGLFAETHPDPEAAKSDGPNSWPLDLMPDLLKELVEIDQVVKASSYLEDAV